MPPRIRPAFTFGGEIAESDPLLADAFLDNGGYSAALARDDPRRFVIGRTGSGKSAIFEKLSQTEPKRVVRISPDNLSLTYIANLDVVQKLRALGVHLDIFFVALWKHVVIVELLKHRYQLYTPELKDNVLHGLLERFKHQPSNRKPVQSAHDFGDKFCSNTNVRFRTALDIPLTRPRP